MQNCFKYVLVAVILFLVNIPSEGQVLDDDNNYNGIEAEFARENINIEPRSPFFNILKIINTSDRDRVINLSYETPVGWHLITEREKRLSIGAKDTLYEPLRASAHKKVQGEVGYSITASITTRSGDALTSANCFIKVPRESDLRFRPLTRVSYFDQEKKDGDFSFRLSNEGNVDEVVTLDFTSTPDVTMKNESNNHWTTDIRVPPKTDTVLEYDVDMENGDASKTLYRIDLKGESEFTDFNSTFWFRSMRNAYHHTKPKSEMPLVLELHMNNLFSDAGSYFSGSGEGNILFRKNRNFQFYFHKYPSRGQRSSFLRSLRMKLNYNTPAYSIRVGDRIPFQLRTGFGKGVAFQYKGIRNSRIQGKYSRNTIDPINNYGTDIDFNLFNSAIKMNTSFEYSNDRRDDEQIMLASLGSQFNIWEEHNIRYNIAASKPSYKLEPLDDLGFHYNLDYTGNIDKLRLRLRNRYNSDNYYGGTRGRNDLHFNAKYGYIKGYSYNLNVRNSKYTPSSIYGRGGRSDQYRISRSVRFRTTRNFPGGISLYGEPEYANFNSNSFYNFSTDKPFILDEANFKVGGRAGVNSEDRISSSIKGGVTFVSQFNEGDETAPDLRTLEARKRTFNAVFDLNYFGRKWGAYFRYNYGPSTGNQYYTYFYSGNFFQLLRLMPYYRDYIYKDIIEWDSRLNYMYSINENTHRLNWGNELRLHLRYDLLLRLVGNFTLQSTVGESRAAAIHEQEQYTYTNSYFELRLQKQFDWNQPRMKHHDLEISLYKDLNGNLQKDYNEPGIKNIMVKIEKIEPSEIDSLDIDNDYESSGNLAYTRFLSGSDGIVSYENIPEGVYRISIKDVGGNAGKFSPDEKEVITHINQDRKVHIPFLERNKIFGKIIMNRSKLSSLGPVDISNVKVTATDSKGRTISTLTNSDGEFEMYAPSVDLYTVSVNNIFEENFDLRKNDYKVQLNGYKQFEVNFIFDEKRRRVNFTPSTDEQDVEVRSVKRTNLSGVVKDESTLQPVRANIEVVDDSTGSTIESTRSDRESGRFSMSFMTGPDYSMIVSAPGYWFYSDELELDEMLTIQDVEKEVLLSNIMIGSKTELDKLLFEAESTEIPNEAYPELDRLIEQLKENQNVRIQIAGHSDALETLEDEDLSVERAKAVAKYMMQNGFSNIEYVGHKDDKPVAPNDSDEERRQNRRVEIIVVDK